MIDIIGHCVGATLVALCFWWISGSQSYTLLNGVIVALTIEITQLEAWLRSGGYFNWLAWKSYWWGDTISDIVIMILSCFLVVKICKRIKLCMNRE